MADGASLAEELRSRRAALRLTQAELAERAGISERAISDMERGLRRLIYKDTLRRLVVALGLEGAEAARFEAAALGREIAREAAVPIPARPIFGRSEELALLEDLVSDPATRIVTITGPGGVGKTRLALELGRRLEQAFPDGVFFVPLGDLHDPKLALPRAAGALKARGAGDAAAIAARLRGRRALLVLDTLEHLLQVAPALAEVAARCAPAVLLLTSRVPLNVTSERQVALQPLQPEAAIAMFESCMRSVRPVNAEPREAELTGEICLRLDRLPLAIELAAARARVFGVGEIRGHLERRLPLLSGGPVDLPERQRSMAATIGWSYDLLASADRVLLEQLSVFAGGWTVAAAESVCGSPSGVLAGLAALVDASLVQFEPDGIESHYRLLDTVREYALERLGARVGKAGVAALQKLHAEYFAALAEAAEPHLRGADQGIWLRRLRAAADNLGAALEWALRTGATETALRLAGSLWMFWRLTGAFPEGRAWLRRALELDATGREELRAGPLWGAGWLAYQQGDLEETAARGAELAAWARAAGDLPALRNGVTVLGQERLAAGDYAAATRYFDEALSLARQVGAPWLIATSCLNRSVAARQTGDVDTAAALLAEAEAIYAELGDVSFVAKVWLQRAYLALIGGDTAGARSLVEAGLAQAEELGDRWAVAEQLDGLAAVLAAEGDAPGASREVAAAERVWASIGAAAQPVDRRMTDAWVSRALAAARPAES